MRKQTCVLVALVLLPMVPVAAQTPEANVDVLRSAAERGHAGAQIRLGHAYYMGRGVPQDYAQAARWYRQAADQGHAEGQYWMGILYFRGLGVPKDYAEAYRFLDAAASQSEGGGQYKRYAEARRSVAIHLIPSKIKALVLSEPVVAAVGIVVSVGLFFVLALALMFVYNDGTYKDGTSPWILSGYICAFPALYFLVRFLHWAWVTPIPFVGG